MGHSLTDYFRYESSTTTSTLLSASGRRSGSELQRQLLHGGGGEVTERADVDRDGLDAVMPEGSGAEDRMKLSRSSA